jgi:hypothetical protein
VHRSWPISQRLFGTRELTCLIPPLSEVRSQLFVGVKHVERARASLRCFHAGAHRVQQQHHSGDPQSLLRKAFPLGFLTSQDSRSKHSAQCVAGLSTRRSHKSKVLPLGTMSTAPSTSRHGLDRLGRRVHTSSRRCFRDDNSMSRNSFHETAGEYTISLGR